MTTTNTTEPKQRAATTERADVGVLALWGLQLAGQKAQGNPYATIILDTIGARAERAGIRAIDAFNEAYFVLVPGLSEILRDGVGDMAESMALVCTNFVYGYEMDSDFRVLGDEPAGTAA